MLEASNAISWKDGGVIGGAVACSERVEVCVWSRVLLWNVVRSQKKLLSAFNAFVGNCRGAEVAEY